MTRPLHCLFGPLDEINAALEAFADSPDAIRDLSRDEIADLIIFAARLRVTARCLERAIEATEKLEDLPAPKLEIVSSKDHPIIRKIVQEAKDATERAARICGEFQEPN